MPGKTTSHADNVLNLMRSNNATAFVPYIGLFSVAPSDAGGGTEISGNGYARSQIAFGAPSSHDSDTRQVVNTDIIEIGPATADWPQAVAFGIFDAASGGILRYWDFLATPKTVLNGDYARFNAGDIIVREG